MTWIHKKGTTLAVYLSNLHILKSKWLVFNSLMRPLLAGSIAPADIKRLRQPTAEPIPIECSYMLGGGEELEFAEAEACPCGGPSLAHRTDCDILKLREKLYMTIHLPKDLESSIRAEVLSGHFASEDDLVAAAVRAYLCQRTEEPPAPTSAMGSIGAMRDDADLLEQVTKAIMYSRETRRLRLPPDE